LSLSEEELEALYRKESHADLKERLLLVIKVEGDGMIQLVLPRSCAEAERGLLIGLQDTVKKV